ncbi:MAG: sulfate/molybdate ABC transporter ATP-binding protein [Thermincolia bacterium]
MNLAVEIKKALPDFTLDLCFTTGKDALGILGASGSGKSMTLRCIAGLETPDQGRIILNGRTLFDSEKGINLPSRERKVGFLFQNYALFPHLTAAQNVAFGLHGLPKGEQARRAKENLSLVRLEDLEERYPHQLSGGQQQRVALARALATEPEALLLDEPLSALDNHLRSAMEKQLMETLSLFNGISLFVTHDLEEAYRVCHNLIILDKGRKIACGHKENLFQRPPTFAAAQLTGCKNLSRARAAAPGQVEALDWGCTLRVNQPIPSGLTHVGIRAHHLTFVDDPTLENTYPSWVDRTNESPHRIAVYLTLGASSDFCLQLEVYKEKWALLKDRPFPWLVHLDPELLFLIEGW